MYQLSHNNCPQISFMLNDDKLGLSQPIFSSTGPQSLHSGKVLGNGLDDLEALGLS